MSEFTDKHFGMAQVRARLHFRDGHIGRRYTRGRGTSPRNRACASTWRNCSPTFNCRCEGPEWRLERAGNFLDLERFDHIAFANIVIVFDGHAALKAVADFADIVLEAPERPELTLIDDHVIAQQTASGIAADDAIHDTATGNLADLGDRENLADLGMADNDLFLIRVITCRKVRRVPHRVVRK